MKLRHIIYIACALVAGACSEEISQEVLDGEYQPGGAEGSASVLLVSPTTHEFSAVPTNGAVRVNVTASGAWTVTGFPAWVSVDPVQGVGNGSFALLPDNNEGFTEREATFKVRLNDSKLERSISLKQAGLDPYLKFADHSDSYSTLEVSAASDNIHIVLDTNVDDITVDFDYAWATPTYYSGTKSILLQVQENTTDYTRSGELQVSSSTAGKTLKLTVKQVAGSLKLDVYELDFTRSSNQKRVAVTSGMAWSATAGQSWITVDPAAGDFGTVYSYIKVAENTGYAREGYVTFKAGTKSERVIVRQEANTLTTDRESITPYATTTSGSFYIYANTNWKAQTSASWITLRSTSGTGSGYLYFDIKPNTGTSTRTATIKVYYTNAPNISATVTVTQSGQ